MIYFLIFQCLGVVSYTFERVNFLHSPWIQISETIIDEKNKDDFDE